MVLRSSNGLKGLISAAAHQASWLCSSGNSGTIVGSGAAAAATAAASAAAASTAWPSQLRHDCRAFNNPNQQQLRHKHTVKMVLLKDHPRLGGAGSVVSVKAGHARYELFPQGVADYAIPGVLRRLKELSGGPLPKAAFAALPGRRGRAKPPAAAAAGSWAAGSAAAAAAALPGGSGGGGGSAAVNAEQVAEAIRALASRPIVARRRYRYADDGAPRMVGAVHKADVARLAAQQLRVGLPRELVMLTSGGITDFGEYAVPLNLTGADGRPVELRVHVLKSQHM